MSLLAMPARNGYLVYTIEGWYFDAPEQAPHKGQAPAAGQVVGQLLDNELDWASCLRGLHLQGVLLFLDGFFDFNEKNRVLG